MKTAPQYMYIPNHDGTYIIYSYVFSLENCVEYKNYVTYCETEPEAIVAINRLLGII